MLLDGRNLDVQFLEKLRRNVDVQFLVLLDGRNLDVQFLETLMSDEFAAERSADESAPTKVSNEALWERACPRRGVS